MRTSRTTLRHNVAVAAAGALLALVAGADTAIADTLLVPDDYGTIQAAIDAAFDGDEIIVADGVYTGDGNRDMDFGGRAIALRSENGPESCIIDIDGNGADPHRALHFHSGETAGSVVEGFTIQGGFMVRGGAVLCEAGSSPLFQTCVFRLNTAWTEIDEDGGGAVYNLASSPTFNDCEFSANHVEVNANIGGGGGMQSYGGSHPTLNNCRFIENTATQVGSMVIALDSSVTAHDCEFRGNTAETAIAGMVIAFDSSATFDKCQFIEHNAPQWGGAINLFFGSMVLTDCTFSGNSTGDDGAAVLIQCEDADAVFTNCLFTDNHSGARGGGMWIGDQAEVAITNCTFTGNTADLDGGALAIRDNAEVTVDNSILWNNEPDQVDVSGAILEMNYSNIEGFWGGPGNIESDPLFVDPDNGDFHLAAGSPCIDAADNFAVPKGGLKGDLDGNPRFVDDPKTRDTGNGDAPIVDMGAYEFQVVSCDWDLDGDGSVGTGDLIVLLGAWGDPYGTADLVELLGNWGPCP